MKLLSLALLCSAAVIAADLPVMPKELPRDRQEEVSRAMLALQGAQLATKDAQMAVAVAKDREQQTTQAYLALIDKLRKEFGLAQECQLTMDKTWSCPKEEKHDVQPKSKP